MFLVIKFVAVSGGGILEDGKEIEGAFPVVSIYRI
jgi:hypothetical protein